MIENVNFQNEKISPVVNPFTSKVTIPDSFILSGYIPHPYSSKTFQNKLFNYLDRPTGWKCLIYHLSIFTLVITTLTMSALETVRNISWTGVCLYYLEILLVIILTLEYIARIWAAGSQSCYQHFKGHIRYMCKLANIFDLIILVGSILSLTIGASEGMFTASTMKIFRLVQIIRIARIDRRGTTWGLLSSVIYSHRKELITSLYIGFLGLLVTSYIMFIVENYNKPSMKFKSLADAFYWGIVTVTTIGYGDITPETWLGKTICACGSIITISFFALPAGILGSGFALKVQQKQRQKHYNKQIPAAATLIQMGWRYNRTNCFVGSNATWTKYAKTAGEYRGKRLRRRRDMMNANNKDLERSNHTATTKVTDNFSDYENYELTTSQRKQIRILSVIQFQVARKKFQQLRNPYDVQDVIEQYSQGHFHLMIKMKDIHRKLDNTIGNINEGKLNRHKPTIVQSIDMLNHKINQLELMISSMHKVIMSLPTDLKINKDFNDQFSPSTVDMNYENSDFETSSDEESLREPKTSFFANSNSLNQRNAKSLYNDRFYLGHQSILSD